MREAGAAGRTEAETARLQGWHLEYSVMWVSEMPRADGITLRVRFMVNLAARARRCEPDAIRLCNITFGRGCGPGNQSGRPRVGLPTPAAWGVVGVGNYVWYDGALGRVRAKVHADAAISVFTADAAPRRITARTNVKFTMSRSEVVHYDSPPLLVDTSAHITSGCVHVRHHEIQALRAVEMYVLCPPDLRYETTCSAVPSAVVWPDVQQDASRVDSDDATLPHTMLAWGCHYRNLVAQAGHAWVAADLSADPQVARAMHEAAELSAAEDGSQPIPALLAYSGGSVTANGALGTAAAMLRIGTNDVFAIMRLASADTALSSGRSEWTGLLLVLYIAKHVRDDLVVRLGNLQFANAFIDGAWRFRRNWLRRNRRFQITR